MIFTTDTDKDQLLSRMITLGCRVVETAYGGPVMYEVFVDPEADDIVVQNKVTGCCHRATAISVIDDAVLYEKSGIIFRDSAAGKLREARYRETKGTSGT